MTIFQIITNHRQRHDHQMANDTGSHESPARALSGGTAGRRGPATKRIAAIAGLAMLVSAFAYAAPTKGPSDPYARAFNTIASDNDFRKNYDKWRREFPDFNWTNNGCTWPAKWTGFADNFFWPCVQHDFGYGNNRKVNRHNEATRKFIDREFLEHMRRLCSHYSLLAKPGCYSAANDFYIAVRAFGKSHF